MAPLNLQDPLVALGLLFAIAFAPPLLFAYSLRNAERHRREPWRAVAKAFLWGVVGAALIAIVAEEWLISMFPDKEHAFRIGLAGATVVLPFSSVVIAPLVEETAKMLGLVRLRDRDPEMEDGLIYGGMTGLGFAAIENVVYIATAFYFGGQGVALMTAAYRGIATVSLHGAASAFAGYGLWQARFRGKQGLFFLYFALAVLLHAVYNALASLDVAIAALAAAVLAIGAYVRVRRRVVQLDRAWRA